MEKRKSEIALNLKAIQKDLKQATLIAVSKFKPLEDLLAAYEVGQRHFGENRVQELKEKAQQFEEKGLRDVVWHFIGHLQTNKVNTLLKIPNLSYIHSVDSLKLLEELYKKEELLSGRSVKFFLEIKTSGEEEKEGIESEEELQAILNLIQSKTHSPLQFSGLMTMGKIRTDDLLKDARICFQALKTKKECLEKQMNIKPLVLSMGMSQDWSVAVEEGANFIRVGSAIFGDRS